jgi:hypothetical protein
MSRRYPTRALAAALRRAQVKPDPAHRVVVVGGGFAGPSTSRSSTGGTSTSSSRSSIRWPRASSPPGGGNPLARGAQAAAERAGAAGKVPDVELGHAPRGRPRRRGLVGKDRGALQHAGGGRRRATILLRAGELGGGSARTQVARGRVGHPPANPAGFRGASSGPAYAVAWVRIKARYNLSVTPAEKKGPRRPPRALEDRLAPADGG